MKLIYIYTLINYYVSLSKVVDSDKTLRKYLDIYEPIIKMLEEGKDFYLRSGYIEIDGVYCMSIKNWKEVYS